MRRHKFELDAWFNGVVLFLSAICFPAHANHEGYLRIDCGTVSDTYQDNLGLTWSNDGQYILTGRNIVKSDNLPVAPTIDNYLPLQDFRYFPEKRNKHCYELPTTPHTAFLIRAMFLHGNSSLLTPPIQFDVSINATNWFSVHYQEDDSLTVLNTTKVFEGIFNTSGSLIYFCLLPVNGTPFISSLELGKLDSEGQMYSYEGSQGKYLHNLFRYNAGAEPGALNVRYPDDAFDRFWYTPSGEWVRTLQRFGTTRALGAADGHFNIVPPKVMQDAWMYETPSSSMVVNFSFDAAVSYIYAALYFQEISPNALTLSTVRGLTVSLDGKGNFSLNVSDAPYMYAYSNWHVESVRMNITFKGLPLSTLCPIVNAIEVYAQYEIDNSTTATQDVEALNDLQTRFNLTDWKGDPCYPVSWNWVACNSSTSRVIKLFLSNAGISGTLPQEISQMDALTEIHLDHNNFNGEIPDWLATLSQLKILYLQNNKLSGLVSQTLLHQTGLIFRYDGNPYLQVLSPAPVPSMMEPKIPAKSNSTVDKSSGSSSTVVTIAVILGSLLVVGIILRLGRLFYSRRKNQESKIKALSESMYRAQFSGEVVGYFPLKAVLLPTNNYANKIGEGSYGPVYRGRLVDGREVAVKLNKVHSIQGMAEFINEIALLTRIHHKNLVSLIGYCNDHRELILIYEYQAKGTLQDLLYGPRVKSGSILDWRTRLDIAWNAAKGLEYLHTGCNPPIIHRDVKSNNILLDDKLVAKVADFGISKTYQYDQTSFSCTGVKGTIGYLDPEYHRLTQKSDVYSFGVVLSEIITGRPPIWKLPDKSSQTLRDLMKIALETNNIRALVDPLLQDNFRPESMWKLVEIAWSSLDLQSANRPDMTHVVCAITEARKIEIFAISMSNNSLVSAEPMEIESNFSDDPLNSEHSMASGSNSCSYQSRDDIMAHTSLDTTEAVRRRVGVWVVSIPRKNQRSQHSIQVLLLSNSKSEGTEQV